MVKNEAEKIWSEACRHLAETLSKDIYDRWISVIGVKSYDGEILHLSVTNDFYFCWLEENYLPMIKDSVAIILGRHIKIELQVDHTSTPAMPQVKTETKTASVIRSIPTKKPNTKKCNLNSKYNFEGFVVGSSNSFAHAACIAVSQTPAKAYNPLFIYGCTGLGKTHLIQAIGHYVISHKYSEVCYVSSETFINEYIGALQNKRLIQFRQKYRNTNVLLIDDIHFLAGKERMQEEFFHTFNELFNNHKQIVMTSDRPASEITGLEKRLVGRFEWGLVTQIEEPDVETRIAILRNNELKMKISLSDEIINFIAERICSNIRSLEGALIRTASYLSLTKQEVTLETLNFLLRDILEKEKKVNLSIDYIQKTVADFYDIKLNELIGSRRLQHIAFPRQVAMYLCRTKTPNSLPVIGEAFSRNHATVLHACRTVDKKINNNAEFKKEFDELLRNLENH